MENYFRTDLACEVMSDIGKSNGGEAYRKEISDGGFEIERLIITEESSKIYGKPEGNYITIHCGRIWEYDDTAIRDLVTFLSSELRKMAEKICKKNISENFTVLIVGLGNEKMTPDAVGPETVSRITVTRHLADADPVLFKKLECCSVSAIAPGVLGQTGIETAELVLGAVKSAQPDIVIAVDALAARSCERLATTLQISDSGIFPGSGIGNKRAAICKKTLGVPVIALGVPTVITSSTLIYDALGKAGVEEISDSLKKVLENGKSYFVSPKECDVITRSVSRLLAAAIDEAFGINLGSDA